MKPLSTSNPFRLLSLLLVISILASGLVTSFPNRPSAQAAQAEPVNLLVRSPANSAGGTRTYTTNADFDEGSLINITHRVPDQLQLDDTTHAFNFIWVAASGRGTVIKIDTTTGQVLGEYWSSPQGRSRNPSRTTVDNDGNVWVGNRDEGSLLNGVRRGSVVHLGLQENGQCEDRNGNGVIDTSTGLGDIRPWPNTGGADNAGGVSTAQDECIIHYVRTPSAYNRHVSVDGSNNVWVGGAAFGDSPRYYVLLDSEGNLLRSINLTTSADTGNEGNISQCCYGGLVDANGVLWSAADGGNQVLRIDPAFPNGHNDLIKIVSLGRYAYGMGIDSAGNVWVSNWSSNSIKKISPAGVVVATYATGGPGNDRGVAITDDDNVWVANSGGSSVSRLRPDGSFRAEILVGREPTGVAVAADGKVWATNYSSHTVSRIDPATNTVDLTVSIGSGAYPYNYSDMTGSTLTGAPDEGSWTVVYDSGIPGAEWGSVKWTADLFSDGVLAVFAASSPDGVNFSPDQSVSQNADLTVPDGQYLRVRVQFERASSGESPILYDLTVSTANQPPVANAGPDQVVDEGSVITLDGSASYDPNDDPLRFTWEIISLDGPPVILSSSSAPSPSFLGLDDGLYTFRLTVSDGRESDSDEVSVRVQNIAPSITPAVDQGYAGGLSLATANFTDPGWLDTHQAWIDWGDGSPSQSAQITAGAGWGSLFGAHIYENPGSYAIFIELLDDDGGLAQTQTVTVDVLEPAALWANSQVDSKTFVWTGGGGKVEGRVHTNHDLTVLGNSKVFSGSTTYVGNLEVNPPNTHSFTPPPVQTGPQDFPFRYNLADFRPGGIVSTQVGQQYFDMSAECGGNKTWQAVNQVLPDGVYYVNCDAKLNGSQIGGSITLVAEGSIEITGSRPAFEPFFDGLLFLSGASGSRSIKISASNSKFLGYLFTELGEIELAGANNRYYCGILGDRLNLSGEGLTVLGSGCARPQSTTAVTTLVPQIDLDLAVDQLDALPGDELAFDLGIANAGATLLVPGVVGAENVDLADATLAFYSYTLEYFSLADQAWMPLAVASSSQPGYTPLNPPPAVSELNYQAVANPSPGVSYPSSGDPLLNTNIQPGSLASWGYQARLDLTPEQVELLLDPTRVDGIRNVILFEFTPADVQVRQLFRFGDDFIQDLRLLSGSMTDVQVTFVPPAGDPLFFTQVGNPDLAQIDPGGAVSLSTGYGIPAIPARDPAETDTMYLGRLQAADGNLLHAFSYATARGGVGLLVAPELDTSTLQHLPILNLEINAPASLDAGGTIDYDISLRNAGSATASGLEVENYLAGVGDLPVSEPPLALEPAEVGSVYSFYAVPRTSPGGTLDSLASTTWLDANANLYGPLYAGARTQVIAAPALEASKTDSLAVDPDGNGVPSAGDTLAYQVTVTNHSTGPANSVRFTDMPDVNSSLLNGSVTTTAGSVILGNTSGDPSVQVDISTIPGGGNITIGFQVLLDSPLPEGTDSISNQGQVESTGIPAVLTDDPAALGASDPTVTPLRLAGSQLEANLNDFLVVDLNGNGQVNPGDTLRYELFITNNGQAATTGVVFTTPLDPYLDLVVGSVGSSQGTVEVGNAAGDTSIQVNLGTLSSGGNATVSFRATVADPLPLGVSMVAVQGSLSSNELDPVDTDDPSTSGSADATITPVIVPDPQLPAPTIGDLAPPDGAIVTEPVAIQASFTPPEGQTIASWRVTYRRMGTDTDVVLASGVGMPLQPMLMEMESNAPVANPPATLATFDPTRLPNGAYLLTVSATASGGGVQSSTTSLIVDGDLKLGRYLITYQDLLVPLIGLPMQVLRTYDSFDKAVGDFGVGWNVSLANFQVYNHYPLGQGGWRQVILSCGLIFCTTGYETSMPHYVTIVWPDGRQEIFDLTPSQGSTFFSILTTAQFTGREGTTSKLQALGDTTLAYLSDGNLYGGLFGQGGIYDPTQFQLTARDGTKYILDRNLGLLSATDRNGNTLTVSDSGISSSAGPSISFTRDTQHRITRIAGPSGETIHYAYSPEGDLASFTNPLGQTFTYTYDDDHNLLGSNDPDGYPFRTLTYDADGRLVSVTDGEGNTTTVTTDIDARQEVVTDAAGRLTTISTFDELGNLIQVEEVFDGTLRTTRYEYDANRNLITLIDPLGHTTRFTYGSRGNPTSITDALGNSVSVTYDAAGEPLRIAGPDGITLIEFTRDAAENPTRIDLGAGDVTQFTYDSSGRVVTITNPLGGVSTIAYDSRGNVVEFHDPQGAVLYAAYDASNRITSLTDPLGGITRFEYDAEGNLTRLVDPNNHSWRYAYDFYNRLLSITDPLGRQKSWAYDGAGRAETRTNRGGGVTHYSYDANGRVTSQVLPDGSTTTFTYDGLGRITSAVNPDARLDLVYDLTDLVQQVTTSAVSGSPQPTSVVAYDYDAVGNPTAVTTAAGTTLYEYDNLYNLVQVDSPSGLFQLNRNLQGRLMDLVRPNGVESSFTWNVAGEVSDILHTFGSSVLDEIHYAYNLNGDRSAITDQAGLHTFSYDLLGQLTQANHPASQPDEMYAYDPAGNRTGNGQTYDAANRLLQDALFNYTYDLEGRLLTRTERATGDQTRFTWDADGLLRSVEAPDGSLTTYRYDAFGRRIEIDDASGLTRFGYGMESNALLEYAGGSAPVASYQFTDDFDYPLAMSRGGQDYLYLQDALKSVTALVNMNGTLAQSYQYGAFGQPQSLSPAVENPFTFTGREYDTATSAYHLRARPYDPSIGRFLAEDPLPASNQYPYAFNNPLTFTDPLGMQATVEYATLNTKNNAQAQSGTYYVYRFWDIRQGRWYYGITKNFETRIAQHGARVAQGSQRWLFSNIKSFNMARGIEQRLINNAGLNNLANLINSISKSNPIYQPMVNYGTKMVNTLQGFRILPPWP